MKRRDFLKSTAALYGAGVASRLGLAENVVEPGPKPNILFILVDELRYPSVFPHGINDADGFFRRFMPNLYKNIWKKGVRFGNYHTSSNACTPARGTIISGLYSQQSWLLTTILDTPNVPVLNPAFPTYGKLLQQAGYQTPYRGKWHVSIPDPSDNLNSYGFQYDTYPDPTGSNLQGTYGDESADPPYHNDAYTANQAIDYLKTVQPNAAPWCLTVGFVNPHDREFFPAGTEFQTVTDVFNSKIINPRKLKQNIDYSTSGPRVPWTENKLKSPPDYGFPLLPPNWETPELWKLRNKPTSQTFIREFSALVWGGVTNDPLQFGFRVRPYGNGDLGMGVAKAPFRYWKRGLDSYAQIIKVVDDQIGAVVDQLNSLPQSVIDNTIIVFASDHGEYAGAHGILQGKLATVYEECIHIPLIVMDPSGRFTGDTNTIRTGLCSSVDLLKMLVTLGNKGSTDWLNSNNYAQIYGQRHDMYSMLKSRWAPGRPYHLFATDEIAPDFFNFNNSPTNVLGLRTDDTKLGVYANWRPLTTTIDPSTVQLEFYDYSTKAGRLELDNKPNDNRAEGGYNELTQNLIPNELQQILPGSLAAEQEKSKIAHIAFRDLMKNLPESVWEGDGLRTQLGYGGPF
ncbi:sulfatase-like hydrolase/transferase [Edaphobacter modestus]|uniref:Putative sulfatase n=1 Tax=Edaphobacter modestus TaxID=388466 RepID=A0A4V2G4F1_9BACT|nr:sulfatase-like hydrolase/transferase [Edaphobacter modestus]RZU40586.1 putative sulfatase [Edaphobacter modestus]